MAGHERTWRFAVSGQVSRVVEAAGVEPASEGTFPKDSTCVSAFLISHPSCRSGEKPPGARPGLSHDQAPSHHLIASPFKWHPHPNHRARSGWTLTA